MLEIRPGQLERTSNRRAFGELMQLMVQDWSNQSNRMLQTESKAAELGRNDCYLYLQTVNRRGEQASIHFQLDEFPSVYLLFLPSRSPLRESALEHFINNDVSYEWISPLFSGSNAGPWQRPREMVYLPRSRMISKCQIRPSSLVAP